MVCAIHVRLAVARVVLLEMYTDDICMQNKDASFTYGCLDPVMVTQMAKYLDTVYVSGWQTSSTAAAGDEPGPDLADYAYVCSE